MGTKVHSESEDTYFCSSAVDPGILTVLYGLFNFFCVKSEFVKKKSLFFLYN